MVFDIGTYSCAKKLLRYIHDYKPESVQSQVDHLLELKIYLKEVSDHALYSPIYDVDYVEYTRLLRKIRNVIIRKIDYIQKTSPIDLDN